MDRQLDKRTAEILRSLIRIHITSGEPVGSRTISKAFNGSLSPATIRNIMSDLEEAGYLTQPHTSAGRIPSEKGYRYYVDNIGDNFGENAWSKSIERRIVKALADSEDRKSTRLNSSH